MSDSERTAVDLPVRQFGLSEEDLRVDFDQTNLPGLVTDILQCCIRDGRGGRLEDTFFWGLTIGERIECLLAIATLGGAKRLPVRLRCKGEGCGEGMEVEVDFSELAVLQHETSRPGSVRVETGGRDVYLRKPTGWDQLRWLDKSFDSGQGMLRAIIGDLICRDTGEAAVGVADPADEWVRRVDEAMDEADPLVNFRVEADCPSCGARGTYTIDLQEISLRELRRCHDDLVGTIHRLARHYHWGEAEILALPPSRRSEYLALIEKEESR